VYGPYEDKTVLAQRGTPINGPHQGALVDSPSAEWWFVHFQDADLYGRIVHLQPVRWEGDWPSIGEDPDGDGIGRPVLRHSKPRVGKASPIAIPQTSDEFDAPRLGLQWQWHSNHDDAWYSLAARPGHLRLYPQFVPRVDFSKAGNLLLQKFPAREFTAETALELPADHAHLHAGLVVMGTQYAALDVQRDSQGYHLRLLTKAGPLADFAGSTAPLRLRVMVGEGGVCRFGVVQDDDRFFILGPTFHARAGQWIGAKVGIYCLSPDVLNRTFRTSGANYRSISVV
jgi:beta-xylosidase